MVTSIVNIPFFEQLADAKHVLIAGCGGGFDIYSGLPLALALRRDKRRVTLANLTFAAPRQAAGAELITDALSLIDASVKPDRPYFPEWYLARWLRDNGHPDAIYCFERTGVQPLREAYETLIEREGIDAVVLVDGGTDSLMRGDEASLATPHEDISTMLALEEVALPRMLICLGFGVDTYHGVCHAQFLENTADLARAGAFLGTFSLLSQQEEGRAYLDAVRFATEQEPHRPSIVNTSIAAAVHGHFGDHHSTERTAGSKLFINPLMGIYWCYELGAVIERILYKELIVDTETFSELLRIIEVYRKSLDIVRPRTIIPV